MMDAPTLPELIDEPEVERLMAAFGPAPRRHVTVTMQADVFDYWWQKLVVKRNRRGEVALALQRPDGMVLLHTKPWYPPNVYRLLSGGIFPGEAVTTGALREAREETGLNVHLARLAGIVTYTFWRVDEQSGRSLPFVSYVFTAHVDDAPPVPTDADEPISGFRYVPPAELLDVAAQLRRLTGRWGDWGAFRALPHELAAEALGA